MSRRKNSEPVAEDEEWMTTYADAITLAHGFLRHAGEFYQDQHPEIEKAMVGIKEEMGMEKFLWWPLFTLVQSLDSSLDNTNIDLQDVEISFDAQGVVVKFASKSFFKSDSVILLKSVKNCYPTWTTKLFSPPVIFSSLISRGVRTICRKKRQNSL